MARGLDQSGASRAGGGVEPSRSLSRIPLQAFAFAAALLLAACGDTFLEKPFVTEPIEQPRGAAPVVPTRAAPDTSTEAGRLIASYGGIYQNPKVEALVARVVGRLVEAAGRTNAPFEVVILNSPAVNAFALPGGQLFVTRGLIALANDESELAAVIAHEMAHVQADHARLRQRQAEAAALAKRVSEVVNDPLIRAESAEQAAVSLASFSQSQELEADRDGVKLLAGAGFDPFAAARFLEAMKRYSELPSLNAITEERPGFLSTHPSAPSRIELTRRTAREFGGPDTVPADRGAYLRAVDGMLYGDDPTEGFVRGREFAHVTLGIAFTVPDGYVLKNTSSAVLATDGAHTAIRFDAVGLPRGLSLGDYLRSGWIKGLVEPSIRESQIGALRVATASAFVDGWSFRIGVVQGRERLYRFIFASSKPADDYEAAFQSTLNSFRLLSPSQKAAMRPLRVQVVTVRPEEGVPSLAAQMDGVDAAVKRPLFEVINALQPGERVAPGQQVKIIRE